jgi:hypothetical protein
MSFSSLMRVAFCQPPARCRINARAPTWRKLFCEHVNVCATVVLELKYLKAAQHALCGAEKPPRLAGLSCMIEGSHGWARGRAVGSSIATSKVTAERCIQENLN